MFVAVAASSISASHTESSKSPTPRALLHWCNGASFGHADLLVPDVVGFRTDRVPDLPDENPLRVVPDWACEILSPNTVRDDRVKKLRIYAQHDVPWVWLVDPSARTIECFETIDRLPRQTVVAADAEVTSLLPFDDLPFDLARIWGAAPVSGS